MAKKNLRKNYLFNLAYQLLLIALPIVVTPYISRVLRPEGVGQYSFSNSITAIFVLFAALGVSLYGQREVARHQGDDRAQSVVFWEIVLCRSVSVLTVVAINVIVALFQGYGDYSQLMLIMTFNMAGVFFDIAFFFQGREEFGKIVGVNSLVRLTGMACVFIFVKTPEDVWVYTLIMSLTHFTGFIVLWPFLAKSLVKVPLKEIKPFRHLKGTLILFLPTIAVSVYTILDRTLIGLLVPGETLSWDKALGEFTIKKNSDMENGFYEQSEQVVKAALTIITCIGSVMIPRNTSEYAQKNYEQVRKNIYTSSAFVWMIGIPMVFGVILVAPVFAPIFFGEGFEKCGDLMCIFSLLIPCIGFSHVLGLQYLLPSKQDKKFNIAYVVGAVVNLSLNLIFIRFWWSVGAAIATVIAECMVTAVMAYCCRKELDLKKMAFCSWRYLLAGAIMFVPLLLLRNFHVLPGGVWGLVAMVAGGIVLYLVTLILLRDPMLATGVQLFKARFSHKVVVPEGNAPEIEETPTEEKPEEEEPKE